MIGGVEFRHSIVRGVDSCTVFIILGNNAWALSGECEYEFNLATRRNLTSHETGRTQRGQKRLPIILPIAFSDLDWNAHEHVKMLAANVNFIVHPSENLMCANASATLSKVVESVKKACVITDTASETGAATVSQIYFQCYIFLCYHENHST